MTTELTLTPDLADELKSLRRDPDYDGGPVVLDATTAGDPGTPERTSPLFVSEGVPGSPAPATLSAIDRLPGPVILATTGPLDATALALCCACTISYVDPATTFAEIDPADALALGLAGRLTERFGAGAAARILLGAGDPAAVAVPTADPLAAARATAARLAGPGGVLLSRSLAFAARSTRAQAAAYDRELLALPTDQERPR